jgi:hypothetical protein
MRRVIIVGLPPVQILDVSGPLEVFSNAPGYVVQLGSPGTDAHPQTNRGIALAGAIPFSEINGPIDTLVIVGGPGVRDWPLRQEFRRVDCRSEQTITACGVNLHWCLSFGGSGFN